ncbi:hypothetical protein GCM10007989_08930 [Devosia pacifica]|uniref:DUF3995 domain-containing protein n=1 Tax=Devosia pacifica TaxID=1335967 RepID=A0A918S0Q4_9HYPH|nr:DUF3995 domain-containing protein [Devosia pacifica]GHA16110.1 hypothetical protein GCM10007989_08930 [Devosia pacifica]
MTTAIAALMFIPLLSIGFAHILWATGMTWPIQDEKLLAQTVIGTPGIERLPSGWRVFATGALALVSGVMALALADHDSGGLWLSLLGLPFAALFLARGIIGYTSRWKEQRPEPSFRFNDSRVYSPLCIAIGIGFVALVWFRLF